MRGLLNHIDINVSDINRTREFWGWFLPKLNYVEITNLDEGIVNYVTTKRLTYSKRFRDYPSALRGISICEF